MDQEMMGVQPEMQPQSPGGVPPSLGSVGDQMPQEEMRKNLLDMYGKIRSKKQEWDTTKNVADVRLAEAKMNGIRQFFESFEKSGIDPSDPDAMRQFFDKLYEKNPDLYEMLIPVIDSILGPEAGNEQAPPPAGMDMGGEVGP